MQFNEPSAKSAPATKRTFVTTSAAQPEWVRDGKSGERFGVGVNLRRGIETLEVSGQRGLVVEGQHAVAAAGGDDHRLSDGAPTVLDADADRALGADGRADDRVLEDGFAVELEGVLHLQIVAGTSAHERNLSSQDAMGAPHHLLLVAAEPVAQQQHHFVRPRVQTGHAGGDIGAGLAQPAPSALAAAVATEKPGPPSAMITTPAVPGPAAAISPAVEQPITGTSRAIPAIPPSNCFKSYASEEKTTRSFASSPVSAWVAASAPALPASGSCDTPVATHWVAVRA